jgi:hypothetical protein
MVLREVLEPKPSLQEAPRGPKIIENTPYKIQEIRISGCQWAAETQKYWRKHESRAY